MKSISKRMWLRARYSAVSLLKDRRGIAATEFAIVVPIMLVMFFGTVEFSSAVAVDRKVTLVAQTLSDLTAPSTKATITELYVDPATLQARVQWSKGTSPRAVSSSVTVPTAIAVAGSYLIFGG